MLKLPFHVDSPLPLAVFSGTATIAWGVLFWWYLKRLFIGRLLASYFERRFRPGGVPNPALAHKAAWWFMMAILVLFLSSAMLSTLIVSGVLVNGDPPPPITVEEFLEQHKHR